MRQENVNYLMNQRFEGDETPSSRRVINTWVEFSTMLTVPRLYGTYESVYDEDTLNKLTFDAELSDKSVSADEILLKEIMDSIGWLRLQKSK